MARAFGRSARSSPIFGGRLRRLLLQLSSRFGNKRLLTLATLGMGPYKARQALVGLETASFVSPRADVALPDLAMGNGCFIDDGVTLFGHAAAGPVRLGDQAKIYRGSIIEVGQGGSLRIGARTVLQSHTTVLSMLNKIEIGDDVLIAPGVTILNYRHRFDRIDVPMREQGLSSKGDVQIADDVWIGAGAVILEGVSIGSGAVIGAGAVVTRDIPPYAIAAGVPAAVIGSRLPSEPASDPAAVDGQSAG